jgi:iron complex outermembrane receptor protein
MTVVRKVNYRLLNAGLALPALLAAQPALAESVTAATASTPIAGDDILVTARKVTERAIDVPLAVTVISSDTISGRGARSVLDVLDSAPNAAVSGGLAGGLQGQLSIRGISTLVRNIGIETGSPLFIDGIYAGRPENLALELLDVSQVEIIRGPQGTEFGKNTIAGVINVQTREPTPDLYLDWQAGVGNYDEYLARATLNGPLADNLSASVSGGYRHRDGFYRHLSGGKDADNANLFVWRGAVKFAPSSDARFVLRADGLRDRSVPGFFQARNLAGFPDEFPSSQPHRINNNRPNHLSRDAYGFSLTANVIAGEVNLTSVTAYRHSSYLALLDDDQEQVDFVSADRFGDKSRFFSQELRADGTIGDLRYLVGAYYFDQHITTHRMLALGASSGMPGDPAILTDGSVDTRSEALFGRLDYVLIDRVTLSLGLRYTHETKKAAFVQTDETGVFTFLGFPNLEYRAKNGKGDVSPTASITFKVSPHANLYVRYAKGFKSGAYNVDLASSTDGLQAGPETASSIEVGLKSELVERRLWLDLTAFHVIYDDLQISQLLGGGISLSNAGRAKTKGIEAEATFAASDRLRLSASAGLLDADYDRFENCGVPLSLGGGATDCSGNRLVLAPSLTLHAAAEFTQPVGSDLLFARGDVDHRSSVYFEPTNSDRFKGGPRTLLDFRAGYRRSSWEIAGWVKNLTDETYEAHMDDRSALGVLRTTAYGPPRTYGVSVSGRF